MRKPPNAKVVRIRFLGGNEGTTWGWKLFFKYPSSPPDGAQLLSLAEAAGGVLETNFSEATGVANTDMELTQVIATDLSSEEGVEAEKAYSEVGHRSGTPAVSLVALRCSFEIARRYRGGHPGAYVPGGVTGDLSDPATWGSTILTQMKDLLEGITAATISSSWSGSGGLTWCNYSAVSGWEPGIAKPNGKLYYPPKYREEAILDNITGFTVRPEVSTQKRRRTSTSV